jgi:hypothetical protein
MTTFRSQLVDINTIFTLKYIDRQVTYLPINKFSYLYYICSCIIKFLSCNLNWNSSSVDFVCRDTSSEASVGALAHLGIFTLVTSLYLIIY